MISHIKKYYPIIILTLFSLLFVKSLFIKDYLIYGEEQGFINYDFVNYRHQSIWDFSHNFGNISSSFFNIFTMGSFWKISHLLNLSPVFIEQLFLFILVFSTSYFAYSFFNQITKKKVISLLLSAIYITSYNYYAIITTSPKLIHYLILASSLCFWHKYIEKNQKRYIILNCIQLILLLSIGVNPPQMLGAYSLIFLYLFTFYLDKSHLKRIFIFLIPYCLNIIFVFFVNFLAIKYGNNLTHSNPFQLSFSATSSRLHEVLRFFGAWWDYAGNDNLQYNHLSDYYHTSIGVIFTYLPILFFFILLAFQDIHRNIKLKLLFLFITFVLLVKGSAQPMSVIFNTLFNISLFKIFREPWAKFLPDLILVVYLGIAYLSRTKQHLNKIYIVLFIILTFQLIPLLQGRVIDHRNIRWKVSDVKIPSYWQDIKHWSETYAKNKRILILPIALDKEQINQDWYPYQFRGRPEEYFLYSNIVTDIQYSADDTFVMPKYFNKLDNSLLTTTNIDYVLYKNDIKTSSKKLLTINSIDDALDKNNMISFGRVDIYPVKKDFTREKIRTVTTLKKTKQPCNLEYRDANQPSIDNHTQLSDQSLEVIRTQFHFIDPARYKVDFLEKPSRSVGLMYGDMYNQGWKLYSSNSLLSQPLKLTNIPVNCFNNLWIIPKELINQHQSLYIMYEPELLLEQFVLLYTTLFVAYLIMLFIKIPITFNFPFTKNLKLKTITFRLLSQYESSVIFVLRPIILVFIFTIFILDTVGSNTTSVIIQHTLLQLLFVIITTILFISYRLSYKLPIGITVILLAATMRSRLLTEAFLAEKLASWTIIFVLITFLQMIIEQISNRPEYTVQNLYAIIVNDLKSIKLLEKKPIIGPLIKIVFFTVSLIIIILNSFYETLVKTIRQVYGDVPRKKEEYIKFGLKIFVTILIIIFIGIVNYYTTRARIRASLTPQISKIEPHIVYHSNKVIISGKGFGWNKGEKLHLYTQREEIITDLWTDTKIIFTIPLHWKSGTRDLWIEKPINWDSKELMTRSNSVILKIIPISGKMTKDDDEYFEQMKSMSEEALRINGYK